MPLRFKQIFFVGLVYFLAFCEGPLAGMPDSSAEALVAEGNTLYLQGNDKEAILRYQEALKTAKDSSKAKIHYDLGNAYYRLGELEKAVSEYQEALRGDPKLADAKYNLEAALRALRGERLALQGGPLAIKEDPSRERLEEEVQAILERMEGSPSQNEKGMMPPMPQSKKEKEFKKDW